MRFGGGKSAKEAQHETMSDLAPARLATESTWAGDIATRKIRVWADDQYRAQNVRWQQSFEEPLERANLVLTAVFGLRLVPEYHAWERHVAGSTVAADLEALAGRDPGHDVLLVVGLTSSLPLVSATFDDLGYASVGGRHLLVRGYADLEERKLYEDAFRDLLPEERELALLARRHHKTAVVLLHEIGHTFGADHDADHDTLMNASYSHRASSFSSQARDVMLRTLEQRLGRASSPGGESRETIATIKPPPKPSGSSEPAGPAGPLVFHVTPSGNVELGGKTVSTVDIDNLLEAAFARDRNTEVIVRRSRKAPAAALEPIVDRATAIGLKVSITMY
jgi:hypothetical protein